MTPAAWEESLRLWAGRLLAGADAPTQPPDGDCEAVREFLGVHGIGPCLARETGWPRPAGAAMERDVAAEMAREMARHKEFVCVINALRSEGRVTPLVFKGQALAHSIYPEPWLRPRCDIDILVDREHLDALTGSLRALGYRRANAVDGGLILRQSCLHKHRYGIDHYWDVHWAISNRPAYADALSCRRLRDTGIEVQADGAVFVAPNHINSLLIACLHLIGHHASEIRLIWLYDIHLLVKTLSESQREAFIEAASGRPEIQSACHAALCLTAHYLPCDATANVSQALDPGPGNRLSTGKSYLTALARDWTALEGADRLSFVRQHLFPSAAYMARRFGIEHRWQLPFWYALRIGRALPKLFRRH